MRLTLCVSQTVATIAAVSALALAAGAARADAVADFYKGKTVTLFVGASPGGVYSTMAQIIASQFGKHIPGNPNVIVKHMPGIGGQKALNYVYGAAPKDGTVLITPISEAVKAVVFKQGNPRYDPAKINWLGGWGGGVSVLALRKDISPIKSMEEAKTKEVILGSLGKTSMPYFMPTFYNNVFGTKFKIITAYRGGSPIRLAIEKGELHGWHGIWAGWKTRKPDWVRDGKLLVLVQLAPKRHPDLKDVPVLNEFAKTEEQKQMIAFLEQNATDRTMAAPPGVPADRLAALEKAYQALIRDPEFVAAATKRKFEIAPLTAKEVKDAVNVMLSTPPATVAKMKKLMGLTK